MATFSSDRIRQGLPRTAGGVSWPDVAGAVRAEAVSEAVPVATGAELPSQALRSGLPRTPGGAPWPPAGVVGVRQPAHATPVKPQSKEATHEAVTAQAVEPPQALQAAQAAQAKVATGIGSTSGEVMESSAPAVPKPFESEEVQLRRGLPRVVGGDPWPQAGTAQVARTVAEPLPEAQVKAPEMLPAESVAPASTPTEVHPPVQVAPSAVATTVADPAPSNQTSETAPAPTAQPVAQPAPAKERTPIMIGSRSLAQWVKLALLWGGGAVAGAAVIVLAARGVTTLPGVPEFMKRYPGEYHLPEFVEPGFPVWARWSHFFNFFLMVLIIRSGLLVRRQQKPDAFFTPKKGGKKISIYLWLHTSLDVLWLANGVIFVVLLIATGHWARIVPTSWEVFPNAASAALQYLTLEWPLEDGWVNYNSLQQIMYFTVVFIAAPLAAITGVRMSEWWPKDAEKLNKLYPAPVARAIHFPVMLFFVLFILVHVFLVFTTGALKNLNHMFAGTPEISWVGFFWFAGAVFVTTAVTWAARPLVLAPIAGAFGKVSER